MKRILLTLERLVEIVSELGLIVSGIMILLIGIVTTYGVGKRYIFHNPDPYTYELSIIFLVVAILVALPAVQWHRRNLRVDWIVSHFSQRWQNIIGEVFPSLMALIFVGVVVWKSWGIFRYSHSVGLTSQSAWQEPLWPIQLLVPITMALVFLVLISQLVRGILHVVRGTTREDTRIQL